MKEIIESLTEHGVHYIPEFATEYVYDLLLEVGQIKRHEKKLESPPGEYYILSNTPQTKGKYPTIHEVFNCNFMKECADEFFQKDSYILNNKIFITHEYKKTVSPHYVETHYDKLHHLKFLIYLTDTTVTNGAFKYYAGSHKIGKRLREAQDFSNSEEYNMINNNESGHPEIKLDKHSFNFIDMKKGGLIIFDTDTFHGGGHLLKELERIVIRGHSD